MALKISSAQTVSIQTSFAATLHIGSIKINFIFGGTTDFELQPLQSLKIKTPPTKNLRQPGRFISGMGKAVSIQNQHYPARKLPNSQKVLYSSNFWYLVASSYFNL